MTPEQAQALLKPFPANQIQQLPKGGAKLDYVSHAFVTQRLLEVDPDWTWVPVGTDNNGLPQFDQDGGLWIYLTVCGVTRLGYGEATGGFSSADKIKSAIGDAIRNAAMRFGVALQLWQKEGHEPAHHVGNYLTDAPVSAANRQPAENETPATEMQIKRIKAILLKKGYTGDLANAASAITGQDIHFSELNKVQASWVIKKLEESNESE